VLEDSLPQLHAALWFFDRYLKGNTAPKICGDIEGSSDMGIEAREPGK
jgi:hypothetical protein